MSLLTPEVQEGEDLRAAEASVVSLVDRSHSASLLARLGAAVIPTVLQETSVRTNPARL